MRRKDADLARAVFPRSSIGRAHLEGSKAVRMLRNPLSSLKDVRAHGERAVRLAIELKLHELKGKTVRLGIGAGLGVVALLIAPLLLLALVAAAAAALSSVMAVWLAILIVAAMLALLLAALGTAAVVVLKGALGVGRAKG
jgi:hypothetical protein